MNIDFETIMKKQIEQIANEEIEKRLEKKLINLIENYYLKKKIIQQN